MPEANQITVNTLIDVIDTGDGLTSLREALAIATESDEIIFDTGLAGGTIFLNGADLVIDKSLTINGDTDNDSSTRNITIDGQGNSRIFKIDDSDNNTTSEVSLVGLTLTNGFTNNGSNDDDDDGGAIWSRESLTISDSTITGNIASDDGGGIRNDGTLILKSSEITNNTSVGTSATSGGGGLINTTGSNATITATTFSGNTGQSGGGIRNDGTLILKSSTLTANSATSDFGGGALVNTFSVTGAAGTADIINTTISGNTAKNGGGLAAAAGTVTLRNSTLIQNTATATGGGISATGTVNLYNTILAGNTAATGPDAYTDNVALFGLTGVINGDGNNLVGDVSGLGNGTLGSGTDLSLTNLGLTLNKVLRTTLTHNGGLTQTHKLNAKSIAIDGGNNALALDESAAPLTSDQRGNDYARQIGTVDIGAIEYGSTGTATQDTLSGSQGNDYLFGGQGDDIISGLSGNDRISGGEGADTLDGGEGTGDALDYRDSNLGVTVNLFNNTASGGDADGDTILNFERIYASNFDDVLTGSEGNNLLIGYNGSDILSGLGGNDTLRGGRGADSLDGGEGKGDSVDYRGSRLGVTVSLFDNTASGGDAEGDTILNFERIYASNFDDFLTGSEDNNLLIGYDGNDTISGLGGNDRVRGGKGADILDGGEGNGDSVDYRDSSLGVTVNLLNNTASGGDAEGDTIINFEHIHASDFDDALTGSGRSNLLVGYDGNDVLVGLGGNDRLRGGQGADTLEGGIGRDTFEFGELSDSLLVSYDTIVDLSIGIDKIKGANAVAAGNISQLSAVSTLNESGISAVLDTTNFVSAGAAVFTFGSGNNEQTFLALNDGVSGFQASNDSIIEITGFSGSLSNLAIS